MAKKKKTNGSIEVQNIQGSLAELDRLGDILLVMFEREGEIRVDFWMRPSPRILQALGEVYDKLKKHLETH